MQVPGFKRNVFSLKVRGSIYVLVLILLMVSVLFVGVLYKTLNLNILQFTLEKNTVKLERFLSSGLDRIVREFVSNPDAVLNDPDATVYLYEYNICGERAAFSDDQKCDNTSQIIIDKLKKVVGYLAKNGETIQVLLSEPPAAPVVGTSAEIEIHTNPNAGGDAVLVSSYYYVSNTLKVGGVCSLQYNNAGTGVSTANCTGALSAGVLVPNSADADIYGATRVRITPTSGGVSFYRIKVLTKAATPVYLSVTGVDYGDLPLVQQIVFKGVAYSLADPTKKVTVHLSRSVMAHPALPEVFDWVLFNGENVSIVK